MTEDIELLRRYSQEASEEAFTELVERHVNLVYAAALRRSNGCHAFAEEATQQSFIALARCLNHPMNQHSIVINSRVLSRKMATLLLPLLALAGTLRTRAHEVIVCSYLTADGRNVAASAGERPSLCSLVADHPRAWDDIANKAQPVAPESMRKLVCYALGVNNYLLDDSNPGPTQRLSKAYSVRRAIRRFRRQRGACDVRR